MDFSESLDKLQSMIKEFYSIAGFSPLNVGLSIIFIYNQNSQFFKFKFENSSEEHFIITVISI